MTEKLRIYLIFDEANGSCEFDKDSKSGRPLLRHKVILSTKEEQSSSCSLLISKFCEKYNAAATVAGTSNQLDASRLQLKLGTTVIKPNFQPITNYMSDYNDVLVVFLPPAEAEVQHEAGSVACTNFGCGKRFVPGRDDREPNCEHHAGKPVFHDTYKYWSCCKERKTMEFDEFEKIPGCSRGFHKHDPVSAAVAVGGGGGSATKGEVDRKPLSAEEIKALDAANNTNNNNAVVTTTAHVESIADGGAASAGPSRGPREFIKTNPQEPGKPVDAEGNHKCRRFGCGKKFHPTDNHDEACQYHTQGPVFHDTYKFWACCKDKKCIDFDDFEKVPKCAVGPHLL